jgi:hypothetical protein
LKAVAKKPDKGAAQSINLRYGDDGILNLEYSEGPQPKGKNAIRNADKSNFGSERQAYVKGLVNQMLSAVGIEPGEEHTANFVATAVAGIHPRDEVEGMLAAQMAVTHTMSMTLARRLAKAETLPQQDSAARAFNQLTRTYAAQVEALRKYRTGGEQRVLVQHVNVSDGGQAIVGHVTGGRGASAKGDDTP